MNEPSVVLTDFAITVLCLVFCWKLWVRDERKVGLQRYFFGLFASVGAAAFLGGLVHGFFDPTDDNWNVFFWRLTMICVGLSSYNLWLINFRLLFNEKQIQSLRLVVRFLFVVYVGVVYFISDEFYIAILSYIPAALILFLVLMMRTLRARTRYNVYGLGGLVLTFVAAYVQNARIGLHPIYFDHNALYHTLQGVGLLGLYMFTKNKS